MADHLATVTLTTGKEGVQVHIDSDLSETEVGELLQLVADQIAETERPRAAGSWGYRPER